MGAGQGWVVVWGRLGAGQGCGVGWELSRDEVLGGSRWHRVGGGYRSVGGGYGKARGR